MDEEPSRIVRVNATHIGLALPAGPHRVALTHQAAGLGAGLGLLALGALALTAQALRSRR